VRAALRAFSDYRDALDAALAAGDVAAADRATAGRTLVIQSAAQAATLETVGLLADRRQSALDVTTIVLTRARVLTDGQAQRLLAACTNVTTFIAHTCPSAGTLSQSVRTVALGRTTPSAIASLLRGTSAVTLHVGRVDGDPAGRPEAEGMRDAFGSLRHIRLGGMLQEVRQPHHTDDYVLDRPKEAVWLALRHARSVEVLEITNAHFTDVDMLMLGRGDMPALKHVRLPACWGGMRRADPHDLFRNVSMTAIASGFTRFPATVQSLEIKTLWLDVADPQGNYIAPVELIDRLTADLRGTGGAHRMGGAMPRLRRIRFEINGSVNDFAANDLDEHFSALAAVTKNRGIALSRRIKFCASRRLAMYALIRRSRP